MNKAASISQARTECVCGKIEDKITEARGVLMFALGHELHGDLILHIQGYINEQTEILEHYQGVIA